MVNLGTRGIGFNKNLYTWDIIPARTRERRREASTFFQITFNFLPRLLNATAWDHTWCFLTLDLLQIYSFENGIHFNINFNLCLVYEFNITNRRLKSCERRVVGLSRVPYNYFKPRRCIRYAELKANVHRWFSNSRAFYSPRETRRPLLYYTLLRFSKFLSSPTKCQVTDNYGIVRNGVSDGVPTRSRASFFTSPMPGLYKSKCV